MQDTLEANSQYFDEKMKNITEDLTAMITSMMYHIKISKSSPDRKDSTKAQDPTTVVPDDKRDSPLEGGNFTKIGGMRTLKHEINPPKFYELLIKT